MRRSTGGAGEHDEVEKSNLTRSEYHRLNAMSSKGKANTTFL